MKLFNVYTPFSITFVRAKGCYIFDADDNQYLDFYGGHAVISIGHNHPHYMDAMKIQFEKLPFYSNTVINPLQQQLAEKLTAFSGCENYQLFMCNSGAEANENALKLASFKTGKSIVVYFENAFHGRTSGAISVTDQDGLKAAFNTHNPTIKLPFGEITGLEAILKKGNVSAVILEVIQGVGGLDEAPERFYKNIASLCKRYDTAVIIDEVQTGWGRTGTFFAFQQYGIRPNLITMAKGMGNGFPVGGVLVDDSFVAKAGMLGTTFGGNPMACTASLAVLSVLKEEKLLANANFMNSLFHTKAAEISAIKLVKGRGLMLGLVFNFDVTLLRETLLYKYRVFTGSAKSKNTLRILPPLCISEKHINEFFDALQKALSKLSIN